MARVLIVDDEFPVRQLIARMTAPFGHEIAEADNAEAALVAMAATPADVVFCDVQMPGKDGRWLTGEICRLYPTTAVILATGVSTVAPSVSMQSGVLAYLIKPFSRQALLDALARALDWRATATASPPAARDSGAKMTAWLTSLESN